MNIAAVQPFFSEPLVDLSRETSKYRSVYSPEPEAVLPRQIVPQDFLERAEAYFVKVQGSDDMFATLKRELNALGIEPKGLAVDLGSGFGNTVIPMLEHYPELRMIALDISPDLLSILSREAEKRSLDQRCFAVAMDAHHDYFVEGFADIVLGGAVLHHMVNPAKVVKTALKLLKPGGHAIFLEPFENGHAILRLAYEEILAEAKRRGESSAGFDYLAGLNTDIGVRAHRHDVAGFEQIWATLDNKWLFTRTYFEKVAKEASAQSVTVRPLHSTERPFSTQAQVALTLYGALQCPQALPEWAWNVLFRYDSMFTDDLKQELLVEGAVVFKK